MFTSKRTLLRTLERERAAHTAQVGELLATICRLAGSPEPLADDQRTDWMRKLEQAKDDRRRHAERYLARPESVEDPYELVESR